MTRDSIDAQTARELAEKLHSAYRLANSAKRDTYANPASAQISASNASAIIKQVIGVLMDLEGQTDFYGNPTATPRQPHSCH